MQLKRQPSVRLVLALVSCAALGASARLGETEAESQQRYGEPAKSYVDMYKNLPLVEGAVNLSYRFQGWSIRSAFVEGKAVCISYQKRAKKDLNPVLQDDEIQTLLNTEAGGGQWQRQKNSILDSAKMVADAITHSAVWTNSNGRTATLHTMGLALRVESLAAAAFIQARAAAKEQPRKASELKF